MHGGAAHNSGYPSDQELAVAHAKLREHAADLWNLQAFAFNALAPAGEVDIDPAESDRCRKRFISFAADWSPEQPVSRRIFEAVRLATASPDRPFRFLKEDYSTACEAILVLHDGISLLIGEDPLGKCDGEDAAFRLWERFEFELNVLQVALAREFSETRRYFLGLGNSLTALAINDSQEWWYDEQSDYIESRTDEKPI